jgi:hypothetical protein
MAWESGPSGVALVTHRPSVGSRTSRSELLAVVEGEPAHYAALVLDAVEDSSRWCCLVGIDAPAAPLHGDVAPTALKDRITRPVPGPPVTQE